MDTHILQIIDPDKADSPHDGANEGQTSPLEAPKTYSGNKDTIKAKTRMLKALEVSLGIVMAACKRAKVARSQHYEWVKNDPVYKQDVEDIQELSLDFAETMMFKRIKEGSDQLIKYYLGTKGAKRGYQEKQRVEVGGIDGAPIESNNSLTVTFVQGLRARPARTEQEVTDAIAKELGEDID